MSYSCEFAFQKAKILIYVLNDSNFAHFFAYNFFVSKFFAFFSTVSKSA
jgi:hypothetical protein